ncbi:hypothetical protein [Confluentibacter citreus]|uniref:hypothetical protein n=1 Tax=Confluentibacter citreus TaxID=2007307 RepID=UPI000C289C65|nr:hypothetical protein [Confluentibacter citreus]
MSKEYNVLWIDDQHESLPALHKTAIDFNIKLCPYKSMNGGCGELKSNMEKYDAVLLDAKFFENETDEPGTEDTKWVHQTKDRIRDLDKTLSYFVLTGQAKTYASPEFHNAFPNVFNKGVDEDEDTLFNMLVKACQNRTLTKLKHKYPNQFEMCTDAYLGKKHFDRLHNLILEIENPSTIKIAQDSLTGIRKIIEAIFAKLNEIGCIPDDIIQDKGWINGSSIFLSDKHRDYILKEKILHPVIVFNIHKILTITQDGSHNEGSNLGIDAYMASNSNTFLYQSTVLLLLDTLHWLKPFIDNNSVKAKNVIKWEHKQPETNISDAWISGKIIRIADNGWGTFQSICKSQQISIPPKMVSSSGMGINDNVKIVLEPSPDGTKMHVREIKLDI